MTKFKTKDKKKTKSPLLAIRRDILRSLIAGWSYRKSTVKEYEVCGKSDEVGQAWEFPRRVANKESTTRKRSL